jgi:site-specific DNA-cytosine methylase
VPDICKHPDVVASIVDSLSEQGYWVRRYPLLASEYGVAQVRTRFFIVTSLLGPLEAPMIPTTKGTPLTVVDAIGRQGCFSHALDELMLTEAEKIRAERLDIMSGCRRFRELH